MTANCDIFLSNVRLYAFHGVKEQERRVGAWFKVSVSVSYDFSNIINNKKDYLQ